MHSIADHLHVFTQDVKADEAWLLASTPDARSARRTLITAKYPQLVSAFDHK